MGCCNTEQQRLSTGACWLLLMLCDLTVFVENLNSGHLAICRTWCSALLLRERCEASSEDVHNVMALTKSSHVVDCHPNWGFRKELMGMLWHSGMVASSRCERRIRFGGNRLGLLFSIVRIWRRLTLCIIEGW